MASPHAPLTLGTAGHVDHGKTALVAALTGVDTDRLPEEKARGLTIELGYAQLSLASGRGLSLIDVPGHARFVRTMVSGATGIDLFLMVIASDDGVMPQTIEHADVLHALGVEHGVVAITKTDLADPGEAAAQAAELLPGAPIVRCSARTGSGLPELLRALERVADRLPSRAAAPGPTRLHVDRAFTITGRGTVVTGTLWSGTIASGDALELLPGRVAVRVRGVEVHGAPVQAAQAGQRVAVNLVGARSRQVARGQLLAAPAAFRETSILDCALVVREVAPGERVQVLHGTRSVTGRIVGLGGELWQLRLEQPLIACADDRLVIRRLAPPDTIGGGVVLDAMARRHGARPEIVERLDRLRTGAELAVEVSAPAVADTAPGPPPPDDKALRELEQRLRDSGAALLSESQIDSPSALRVLRSADRAVRVSGRLYGHADAVAEVRARIVALIEAQGPVTLAGVRDALGLSRKTAQAFLEHLDNARVTRRLPDDTRVLTGRAPRGGTGPS